MIPKNAWAGAAIMLALACSTPSAAESENLDSCLVGTWAPANNGAAEWMARNAPGMNASSSISEGTLTLRSDGSYSASADIFATTFPDGGYGSGRSTMGARAAGYWAAGEGRLVLAPSMEALAGGYKVNIEGQTSVEIYEGGASGLLSYGYSCSGESFETRMAIPGTADPMVQIYRQTSP
jgi:hypothetical protein